MDRPSFTIGIEEEYLLVNPETRDLEPSPPAELLEKCEEALGDHVSPELLRAQIEVATPVCTSIAEARSEVIRLRRTVAEIAEEFGLGLIAASTHPFAEWERQQTTAKERYLSLADDLQQIAHRMLTCGMHVHIGVEDEELRVDLMNQASYFLPHLLALSTSSPFWEGRSTGLKSYRLSVMDELPRTGVPQQFSSWGEYKRTVDVLVNAGLIEDASKLWWDLRPSARFPTVEMRVTDICPLVEDSIAIAAIFACICRMLFRLRRQNQRWRSYPPVLIRENRWRAQRYGAEEGLVDFGKGRLVPFAELLEELLVLVREDAEELGCLAEVEHTRTIMERGTSADRQIERFIALQEAGAGQKEALQGVVDLIREETTISPKAKSSV
ncbi:Carboxylate-amine ligase YbdK [Methyloligella halotolerans]|uniref:Putative glutamate--cysteine ligase 2 n=1 Tax=Methyloligella halotolerans TaxID=1177755 RepID=A0A1E2RWE6_9HYPH|nr:carboxylate-amine ligase [Methyloligella halotolerans]ODA66554.1 Carboxylate-amine ligase YbdK [Methyloligella halotolerans]